MTGVYKSHRLLATLLSCIAFASMTQAVSLTFQDGNLGYSGTRDTMLGYGDSYGDNNSQNFGSTPDFRVYLNHYVSG
jgi:hypothetical protein